MVDIGGFFAVGDLIFVSCRKQNSLLIFNNQEQIVLQIGKQGAIPGNFVNPTSIYHDTSGHLAVADSGNRRIQIFDRSGKFLKTFAFPSQNENSQNSQNSNSNSNPLGQTKDSPQIFLTYDYIYFLDPSNANLFRLKYF